MASTILYHPHTVIPSKKEHVEYHDTYTPAELLAILEREQPLLMDLERLECLINGTDHRGPAAALRSYLVGVYDARLMMRAVRPDLFQ